jgi:hypothetical protein
MNSQEIQELAGHRKVPAWVVKLVGDAIAAEREACAKLAYEITSYEGIAEAIRARGNNDV